MTESHPKPKMDPKLAQRICRKFPVVGANGVSRLLVLGSRATKRGGFKRGFPDLDSSFVFCPFSSLPDFSGISRFARGWSGDFPIRPFPLSRPIKSTYEEQSRKGPRHNLDLFPKKVGNTRVWKHPGLASLKYLPPNTEIGPLRLCLRCVAIRIAIGIHTCSGSKKGGGHMGEEGGERRGGGKKGGGKKGEREER